MSVTITAVAGPVAPASDVMAEQTLQNFVLNLENSAASGMPQLANPAALASELFGFLRGYVERSQNVQRAITSLPGADGDSDNLVQTAALGRLRPDLHGGPARERLEPAGADNSSVLPAARAGLVELERVQTLVWEQMHSILEETLLTSGTSQAVHSFDSLLRG
jgi:hypothetical protein